MAAKEPVFNTSGNSPKLCFHSQSYTTVQLAQCPQHNLPFYYYVLLLPVTLVCKYPNMTPKRSFPTEINTIDLMPCSSVVENYFCI